MIENCNTLHQLTTLPISNVANILELWGEKVKVTDPDIVLRMKFMHIVALNSALDPYDERVVNYPLFSQYYLQNESSISNTLENDYYISDVSSLSHLERVSLLCALESAEDSADYLILLGANITAKNFELLITSTIMSQSILNDLCTRMSGYILESNEHLLEEYGFVTPQDIVLPAEIWERIMYYADVHSLRELNLVSRDFLRLSQNVHVTADELSCLLVKKDYHTLYSNRRSINKENMIALVEVSIASGDLLMFKIVVTVAMKLCTTCEEDYNFKKQVVQLAKIQPDNVAPFEYCCELFKDFLTNTHPVLHMLFKQKKSCQQSLIRLSEELETAEGDDIRCSLERLTTHKTRLNYINGMIIYYELS